MTARLAAWVASGAVPDDELLTVEVIDEEPAPVPAEPAPQPWTHVAVVAAATVGALALCVGAWAEVGARRAAERSACMMEAQAVAFGGGVSNDPRGALRDALVDCGIDLPEQRDARES